MPARIGIVALDEGMAEDERAPAALLDRLAFHLDLAEIAAGRPAAASAIRPDAVATARGRAGARSRPAPDMLEALCAAASALGHRLEPRAAAGPARRRRGGGAGGARGGRRGRTWPSPAGSCWRRARTVAAEPGA